MSNISAIIGEPGVGKTTMLNALINSNPNAAGKRVWVARPYDGITGTSVGTVDDFKALKTWPLRPRIADDVERTAQLALKIKDLTLVVDEAQIWADKKYKVTPESALAKIAFRGRHHRIGLIWSNVTPWVSDALRSMTYNWIFMRSTSMSVRNWITAEFGKEVADVVSSLNQYESVFYNPRQGLRRMS